MSHQQLFHLIAAYGYWFIAIGATSDSFGVPVPGELMILSAGMYSGATHRLALPLVIVAAAAGAICGDNLSYALGRFGGTRLVERYGEILRFGPRRRRIAQYLFRRYGDRVVLGGRFLPVLHIAAAFLAGLEGMGWPRFALFNASACALWAAALGSLGFASGTVVLRVGDVLTAASIPFALLILVLAGTGLRLVENRLQRQADELGSGDSAA
jgi:membrane protein DedA with SNARE-associated domain